MNRAGIPIGQRGFIGVDTSSFTGLDGDVSAVSIALAASMPFTGTTFFDLRVPLGLAIDTQTDATLGNIPLGAHHIFHPAHRFWISVGGAVGLATLSGRSQLHRGYEPAGAARAYWGLHEYFPDIIPIEAAVSLEGHIGAVIVRGELDPILYIPISRNDQFEFALQHAVELQVGHHIGGGLRIQGAAFPTFDDLDVRHSTARDLYQLAIEPFVTFERKLAFLRTGLLLPIDEELGPPFDHTWGFHVSAGMRVE